MEKLNDLIATCVLKGVHFAGQLGSSAYTVQDLVHGASLQTLNNMFKSLKKQLSELDTDSLFKSSSSVKKTELKLKVETIEAVFEYRQELANAEKQKARLKAEASQRLIMLTHAKDKQELDRIAALSPKKLAKEIAEAEKLAGTNV